jgi:spermidine/putrescine transport system ATP-binding protein
LLDEPLSALDHKMRQDMQIELKEMHKKLGITFIYVTHDQEEALSMSDTIVVMKDGAIQQVGTPESIYNEPTNAYVADFIGESNIYNGTMVGKQQVRFLGAVWNCIDDFPLNEKVDVVIRPEDVEIGNPGKGTVDGVIARGSSKARIIPMSSTSARTKSFAATPTPAKSGSGLDPRGQRKPPDHAQGSHRERVGRRAWINSDNQVVIGEDPFPCDLTQLVKGSCPYTPRC